MLYNGFICVLFLSAIHGVACLTCYCSNAQNCNEGTCQGDVCKISRTSYNYTYQGCEHGFFEKLACSGQLTYVPGGAQEFQYCCTSDNLCNSIEIFDELIRQTLGTSTILPAPSSTSTVASTVVKVTISSSETFPLTASDYLSMDVSFMSSPLQLITTSTTATTTITSMPSLSSSATQTLSSSVSSSTQSPATPSPSSSTIIINVIETPNPNSSDGSIVPAYTIVIIAILAIVLIISVIIILLVTFFHFHPRHIVGIAIPTESDGTPTVSTESCGEFSSNPDLFDGTTSGSGSGMPLLIQQSVAAQVTLHELVGKGRFGEVWRGSYKGDDVAVKIFHTKEENSWIHEKDIYQTCLIRHPNILRFIAADNKDIGIATQLWLISEYCDMGSLYEVLDNQTLDEGVMLKLCLTAASGLAHLHSEIIGTEGKPAIAHRDLKSRNILVKGDYVCTIADLGLALRYYRATDTVEELPSKRVGTRRYLSPEILDDSMNTKNFDCFKRSDIYSFGLVLWEIARRGQCGGHSEDYQLPYFDHVTSDPSFEEMRRVVAIDKKRPSFPNRWSQSKVFDGLSHIIEQCWHHNGEARLTALRIKKNLQNLQSMHGKLETTPATTNQIQISL